MSVLNAYVAAGADDYDSFAGSGGTTILARSLGLTPRVDDYWTTEIDTSALPDDCTIDSATYYYYHQTYTKTPKSLAYSRVVSIWNGSTWSLINSTSATPSVGWVSLSLSAVLSYISKTGKTKIRGSVDAVATDEYRTWYIRAYEYDGSHTYRAYMVINYTEAATGRKKSMILR